MDFVSDPSEKSAICSRVLRALPEWFGIEEAIVEYTGKVRELPFIRIEINGSAVGFCALKVNFRVNTDLYVLGILREYQGMGLGTEMIEFIEDYCRREGIPYMTVKTLSGRHRDPSYALTRKFYEKCGFVPFEEFLTLWGEDNPCLYMLKKVQ